jgi:excisionase family DNA binding protein
MPNSVLREGANLLALSVEDACKYSSLGRTTFYKHVKLGHIPARKCGRRTIVLRDELDQALKSLPRAGGCS